MRIIVLSAIAFIYFSCSTNMNKTQNNEYSQDSLYLNNERINSSRDEFIQAVKEIPIDQLPFGFNDLYNTIALDYNDEKWEKPHWSPAQNKSITTRLNGQFNPKQYSNSTKGNNPFKFSLLNRETILTLNNRFPPKAGYELLLFKSERWREGEADKFPAWYLLLVNSNGEKIDELYIAGIDHKETDLYTETLFWIDENWQIHIAYFVPLNESDFDEESSQDSTLQLKDNSYQRFINTYTIDDRFKQITHKQRNIYDGTLSVNSY